MPQFGRPSAPLHLYTKYLGRRPPLSENTPMFALPLESKEERRNAPTSAFAFTLTYGTALVSYMLAYSTKNELQAEIKAHGCQLYGRATLLVCENQSTLARGPGVRGLFGDCLVWTTSASGPRKRG